MWHKIWFRFDLYESRLFNFYKFLTKMKPNSNQNAESNGINSSINSLTSSFGQLEMNPSIDVEPVNQLPNVLLQVILAKFELDGDVKKLVQLRLVSSRWKSVVEDYCGRKKSLIVVIDRVAVGIDINSSKFEERFFGFAHLKDFMCLFLSTQIPSECLRSLLNIFPNIVQLSVCSKDPTPIPDLLEYINSLDSLKQLDLVGPFVPVQLYFATQTLSKLEHFSIDKASLNNDDHYQLVSHLGPRCFRVYFGDLQLTSNYQLRQWHNVNPLWLANLTHLQMNFCDELLEVD